MGCRVVLGRLGLEEDAVERLFQPDSIGLHFGRRLRMLRRYG
jgi:hypothetical protein